MRWVARTRVAGGGRRGALAAACLLATACAQPTVDALVVWLEADATSFALYDDGERTSVPFETLVEDSDPSRVQLRVVPGGHGFVALPPNDTMVWVDARGGGHAELAYAAEWGELVEEIEVFESGAAVARANEPRTGLAILPTVRGSGGPIWYPWPSEELPNASFAMRSARAAPIVYVLARTPPASVLGPSSTVIAYELASGPTPAMIELGRTGLSWRTPSDESGSYLQGKCLEGLCVSPEGTAVLAMEAQRHCPFPYGDECGHPLPACRVLRYRWQPEPGHTTGAVEALRLPDDCDRDHDGDPDTPEVREDPPEIIAALADGLVLLEDTQRIYRADLDAGTWESIPKLGVGPMKLFPAEQGRAALLLADTLQVIRADEHGLRVHSAQQVTCAALDSTTVSPSGEWLLTICQRPLFGDFPDADEAPRTIVRVSPFGVEQLDGIATRALAIDDGGNALLYSFSAGDNDEAPRGLFVLDAEGRLARVDTLEPAPQELTTASGSPYYFSAAAVVD